MYIFVEKNFEGDNAMDNKDNIYANLNGKGEIVIRAIYSYKEQIERSKRSSDTRERLNGVSHVLRHTLLQRLLSLIDRIRNKIDNMKEGMKKIKSQCFDNGRDRFKDNQMLFAFVGLAEEKIDRYLKIILYDFDRYKNGLKFDRFFFEELEEIARFGD